MYLFSHCLICIERLAVKRYEKTAFGHLRWEALIRMCNHLWSEDYFRFLFSGLSWELLARRPENGWPALSWQTHSHVTLSVPLELQIWCPKKQKKRFRSTFYCSVISKTENQPDSMKQSVILLYKERRHFIKRSGKICRIQTSTSLLLHLYYILSIL